MLNWQAIGAIGELLGALAVLATLIYLAIQLRHARREIQHSVLQSRDTALRALLLESLHNPLLADAIAEDRFRFRPMPGPALLRIKEATGWPDPKVYTFTGYQVAWWFYRSQIVRDIDQLSSDERAAFDSHIAAEYSTGLAGMWWQAWKETRGSGDPTVRYCEEVLRRAG